MNAPAPPRAVGAAVRYRGRLSARADQRADLPWSLIRSADTVRYRPPSNAIKGWPVARRLDSGARLISTCPPAWLRPSFLPVPCGQPWRDHRARLQRRQPPMIALAHLSCWAPAARQALPASRLGKGVSIPWPIRGWSNRPSAGACSKTGPSLPSSNAGGRPGLPAGPRRSVVAGAQPQPHPGGAPTEAHLRLCAWPVRFPSVCR